MDELTERLSHQGNVVAIGGPEPSLADLRRRVHELGYVFVKFTGTAGGTDLGVALDRDATDLSAADLDAGTGSVHLEGTLVLNDDPVRCIADIDVTSLAGTGHLVPVAAN
jgi:hypothetical protein